MSISCVPKEMDNAQRRCFALATIKTYFVSVSREKKDFVQSSTDALNTSKLTKRNHLANEEADVRRAVLWPFLYAATLSSRC
jgi:hypothetical protein